MKARIRCNNCGRFLTSTVEQVAYGYEPVWSDYQNVISRGTHWIAHDLLPDRLSDHYLIRLEDGEEVTYHPDMRQHCGCCDRDGTDCINQTRESGAEVATEVSDFWTSSLAQFCADDFPGISDATINQGLTKRCR